MQTPTHENLIYLDHAATTPMAPEVLDAMLPYLRERYGNPSSLHQLGRQARAAVEDSREQVADWLGARPSEIVFTGSGSEANTLAVAGLARARSSRGRHILTSPVEHHAVLHTVERLAQESFEVELLPVDQDGRVDPASVAAALRDETVLVSVMHGNNEIGTIQPVHAIAEICAERGCPFHVDAVQTVGQLRIDLRQSPISLLTGSGHKLYGPKGIGFCYIRAGVRPQPVVVGGAQERNRRAGTEAVAAIVGLGKAIELLAQRFDDDVASSLLCRDALIDGLTAISGVVLNGPRDHRLPNNVNVSIEQVSGESLLILLDSEDVAVSTGAACSSGSTDPSHVLLAAGLGRERAFGSVRLSVGRGTDPGQVQRVVALCEEMIRQLRELAPSGNGSGF